MGRSYIRSPAHAHYTVIGRIQFLAGWPDGAAILHWPLAGGDCRVPCHGLLHRVLWYDDSHFINQASKQVLPLRRSASKMGDTVFLKSNFEGDVLPRIAN